MSFSDSYFPYLGTDFVMLLFVSQERKLLKMPLFKKYVEKKLFHADVIEPFFIRIAHGIFISSELCTTFFC